MAKMRPERVASGDGDLTVELLLDEGSRLGAVERVRVGLELLAEARARPGEECLDAHRGKRQELGDLSARHTAEVAQDQGGPLVWRQARERADDVVGARPAVAVTAGGADRLRV